MRGTPLRATASLLLAGALLASAACDERRQGARETPAPPEPALHGFFSALDRLESGQADGPLRIVMIGDSHTAGDDFSGELRALLQSRFGNGGRGYLAAGVPYDYYEPRGVAVSQSTGWTVYNSLSRSHGGPFGLAGFRLEAEKAGEVMELAALPGQEFDRAAVVLLRQPGGGRLEVEVDGESLAVLDSDGAAGAERIELPLEGRAATLALTTLDEAPVALLGWTVERDAPGVVLDSIGIGGATVAIFERLDPGIWRRELAARAPNLVILAFGTNEGFDAGWTAESYGALFGERIAAIRAAAPQASLLVVGPPDGNRRFRACRKQEAFAEVCRPLSPAERDDYAALLDADRLEGEACRWHPPPNLSMVREVQRAAAAREGLYFWDWSEVMGGECGIHAWSQLEPPMAWNDHVHLREAGYEASGRRLYETLMRQYATWRSQARR